MPKPAHLSWFWAPLLAGCTVTGGYLGAQKDAETNRTRQIPIAQAAKIPSGSLIYVSPMRGETVKGFFRGLADSAGMRFLRMDTEDGRQALPLDSVSDLVAETHDHRNLKRGLVIGAAIDIVVVGAISLTVYEFITHVDPVY